MKKQERELFLKEKLEKMKEIERSLYDKGANYIAGVDEVGRGPLSGPVVAAAVILPKDFDVPGIDDSKKLSEKRRVELQGKIIERAVAYGIGIVSNEEIDKINILEATKKAMVLALRDAERRLRDVLGEEWKEKAKENLYGKNVCIDHVLIDALTLPKIPIPQTPIIRGDSVSLSIAAASILAKVERDRMMVEYSIKYPGYSFETNKGYGTKAHYDGIKAIGLCPIHRRTFLKF